METISAQVAKNQFGDLLMKVQRAPVEISKHGKRVAVVISRTNMTSYAIKITEPKNGFGGVYCTSRTR